MIKDPIIEQAQEPKAPDSNRNDRVKGDPNRNLLPPTDDTSDRSPPPSLKKAGKYRKRWKASRVDEEDPTNEADVHKGARPTVTPAEIRHLNAQAMKDARPFLRPEGIAIVVESWQVVQEDVPKVGYDMFVR